jgi:hypothetical protein
MVKCTVRFLNRQNGSNLEEVVETDMAVVKVRSSVKTFKHYVYSAYGFWFRKTRTLIHNPIKPDQRDKPVLELVTNALKSCPTLYYDIWQYGEINDGGCTEGSGSTGQRYENDLLGRLGQGISDTTKHIPVDRTNNEQTSNTIKSTAASRMIRST